MKLFTKEIDQKLFDQYMMGNDLENQMVVAKIFNPYGNGVWYLLNSDPSDPDYLWAIVDLFEVEVGSVSREELETLKVPPFRLGLERDLYFTPMNAKKLYEAMLSGEKFEDGGTIDIKKDKSGESWVFPNNPKGETYGIKLAAGGMTAGRYYKDNTGQELRYIGESQGKLLFKDGEKMVYKQESDFEDAPEEKRIFGFFKDGGEVEKIDGQRIITDKNGNQYAIKNWAAQGYIIPYDGSVYWEHFRVPEENWIKIEDINWSKFNISKSDFYNYLDSLNQKSSEILNKYKSSFKKGGETKGKRYKVNIYYGGEMEDEEFYTDSLEEAERASQGGEHSEIYDNHKKEFVEIEYAKGGTVKYYDKDNEYKIGRPSGYIEKEILERVSHNEEEFVGSFGWKTSMGKMAEGYLYNLNDFDRNLVNDIKLKQGEKIFRYLNRTTAIGGMRPFIKINVDKALLYFLVNLEDDGIEFETKGIQANYIALIASKMNNDSYMARGGMFEFKPYGKTKGIYKIYYKAEGKPQTEIWETKEMAVNSAKRYSSPQMRGEYTNIKVFDEDGAEVDYMSEDKYEDGGDTDEGVDLFEDYDDIPENVQKVLDDHSDAFENEDYKGLEKAKKELEKIGYTFEYGLDGEAYDLRKIGQKGKNDDEYAKGGELMKHKHLEYVSIELIEPTSKGWKVKQIETHSVRGRKLSTPKEKVAYFSKEEIKDLFEPMMAKGGRTKFKDKVQSIKASLLKRKKVSPKVQKDYGKTYSPKEAEESAKRIAGSMVKKEKRQPRVSKMLEKMKKGTEIKKKKSTFKDRMKDLSTKIKERKSKTTK